MCVPALYFSFLSIVMVSGPDLLRALMGAMMWFAIPYGIILAYALAWRLRIHRNAVLGVSPYSHSGTWRFVAEMVLIVVIQLVFLGMAAFAVGLIIFRVVGP